MDRLNVALKKEKAQEKKAEEPKKGEATLNLKRQNLPEQEFVFEEEQEIFEKAPEKKDEQIISAAPPSSYISSFENMTVADIKRQEEQQEAKEFEKEKEQLIENLYKQPAEPAKPEPEQKPVNIIEKPNYDFIQDDKKIVKLTKKSAKKTVSKKTAGIVMALVLGASGIICATNAALLENYSSSYHEIEERYNVNLRKYFSDINNLDVTKKSMEFLETYPEDFQDAGSIGEKSNWFDKLCNFLGGLFGG